jgi:hypothetical protein
MNTSPIRIVWTIRSVTLRFFESSVMTTNMTGRKISARRRVLRQDGG